MQRMFPVARLKLIILFAALFAMVATGDKVISQPEAPPQPVASSTSVTAPAPAATAAVDNTRKASDSSFVYIPVILQPGILSDFAQQVIDITNEERARAGCAPLAVSPQLAQAAQGHSQDMALNDFFSHIGSSGSEFWERIDVTGYQYWSAGENIAAGYQTPEAAMVGWMSSAGHRANILNCNYREIGVGYYLLENDTGDVNYRYYWVQVFAQPG